MPKYPEETRNVSASRPGSWVWNDEAKTVEFISSCPAEEVVQRDRKQTNDPFRELQLRSEWLADVCTLNHRGRHSSRKILSHAHLEAYRSSVKKRQGDHVTIDDVKRKCQHAVELQSIIMEENTKLAVSLLQENYSLPIPLSFSALLKRKELDDILTALLLYLSCFFEQRSLENKSKLLLADVIKERKTMAEALAKKAMAQKQLAVCYFSLIMELEIEQHQRTSYRKSKMSSNNKEWLLHACLYNFFCYVAWVTFGRKNMRDIMEEVGRLFYSDTMSTSVRSRAHGDPEMTSSIVDGSVKTGEADPKETGSNHAFKRRSVKERSSQKRLTLSSIVNQRSPLMVSLLPSPRELSAHLFLGGRARRQSPLGADHCDTTALTEELQQQLADVSLGILGKPLCQLSGSDLIPLGEKQNSRGEEEDHEPERNINNDNEDHLGFSFRGSRSSSTGPDITTHTNIQNSTAVPPWRQRPTR